MLPAVLAVLFFLSGASALIYQVLWLRLLGLVFGVTVYAASAVLASFMAGIALGSYAGGRLAGHVARPLLWFGAAEVLIAVSAMSTPIMLRFLQELYPALYDQLSGSLGALTGVRLVTSFLVLIVPTTLMGATLPLVIRSSLLQSGNLGSRFGVLYAANTAGAILGCLAAGLLLIPHLGIRRTFIVAAAANLVVASGAVLLGTRRQAAPGPVEGRAAETGDAPRGARDRRAIAVLITFIISGWASLALEVLWFRVNVLLIRPTVYAFAMMLATVLSGIAFGSAAVAPWLARGRGGLITLAVFEFLIAAAALLSFQGLRVSTAASEWVGTLGLPLPAYLVPLMVTSALTIFPTMFLMGAAFPLGVRLWTGYAGGDDRTAIRRLGVFYAFNVCGAIVGALTAGFLLLPLAGSRATLYTIGALLAASALLLLAVARGGARRLAVGIVGLAALAVLPVPDPFEMVLRQRFPNEQILWREEGVQTTVSVHGDGRSRAMYLDGLHQASSSGTMVHVHRRIGHLGMALHPQAREVLVIGLGGGATAGAASQHRYAQLDVVELSRSVVEAARLFADVNYNLLERPNVRIRVDDGRNRLMLGERKYDVIMADIIQPIHAGATNVYSAEYFSLVRSALHENGLAIQWVFGTDAEYKMIMRTFLSVFPYTTVWDDASVMVGSVQPLQLRRPDFEWKLHVPEARSALEAAGYGTWDALLRSYTAGPDEVRQFTGPGPLLTDDLPAIEYFLSLPRGPVRSERLRGDVRTIVRDD